MEVEKKRMLFFGILLGLAIVSSVVLFFWGNLINRGTIRLIGEPPFDVQIVGFSSQDCTTSPCSIKTKSGYKDLVIDKAGFQSIITSATVKLWRTVDLPLTFQMIPQVTETDLIPDSDKPEQYELVMDKNTNMQALVKKAKSSNEALSYFPRPITKASIIGGKKSALIVDQNSRANIAYFVDFASKTRTELSLEELSDIDNGTWSHDGKYLIFNHNGSDSLWLLNTSTKAASELALTNNLKQISWTYNNDLLFVTDQAYSTINQSEIKLLKEKSQNDLTFGIYNPENDRYSSIGDFPEIQKMPEEFIVTSSGETIYFKSGDKNFRIILGKF